MCRHGITIEIPEIWSYFGTQIHQDFLDIYPDFWSSIEDLLQDMSKAQRSELDDYLIELELNSYSNQQLLEIWKKSGSQLYVTSEHMGLLFNNIRQILLA